MGTDQKDSIDPRSFLPIEDLKFKEYIGLFLGLALLLLLSNISLPLGTPPSALPPQHVQAPWIFGGIQWLLIRWPVLIAGWIVPGLSLILLITLPWWSEPAGKKITRILFFIFALFWVLLILLYRFGI